MIKRLIDLINHKETMIMIYAERDMERVKELQAELKELDTQLLDHYTKENESWLKEQMIRIEA